VVDGGGKIIVPTNKILEIQHQHRFKTEKGKKNTARVDGNIKKERNRDRWKEQCEIRRKKKELAV